MKLHLHALTLSVIVLMAALGSCQECQTPVETPIADAPSGQSVLWETDLGLVVVFTQGNAFNDAPCDTEVPSSAYCQALADALDVAGQCPLTDRQRSQLRVDGLRLVVLSATNAEISGYDIDTDTIRTTGPTETTALLLLRWNRLLRAEVSEACVE